MDAFRHASGKCGCLTSPQTMPPGLDYSLQKRATTMSHRSKRCLTDISANGRFRHASGKCGCLTSPQTMPPGLDYSLQKRATTMSHRSKRCLTDISANGRFSPRTNASRHQPISFFISDKHARLAVSGLLSADFQWVSRAILPVYPLSRSVRNKRG